MSDRTCVVKLGGVPYTIPAFNLDQLERVTDIYVTVDSADRKALSHVPFDIMRIALERCKEPNEQVSPSSLEELRDAVTQILEMSGLKQEQANPPPAPALEAPAGS